MFRSLGRALRFLVWLPFGILTYRPLLVAALAVILFTASELFLPATFIGVIVCGLLMPFELWLRPDFRLPNSRLPQRARAIRPSRSRIAVAAHRAAPRLAGVTRRLPARLQAMLAHAVPEPAAVLHERSLIERAAAE